MKLKIVCAISNAVLAAICITVLILTVFDNLFELIVALYLFGISTAAMIGWLMHDWYEFIPNEKWMLEPYLASTIVSILSGVTTGILYMALIAIKHGAVSVTETLFAGIFGGLLAAASVLPITVI